ncbi:MAG TPA: hypothetical protein VED17_09625 [Nitrososphaerales archaeon]|nr:hypothetical protein [Nitrososphaerales archaeon]
MDFIIRAFYDRDKETLLRLCFESGGCSATTSKFVPRMDGLKELIDVLGSSNPARLMELIKTEDRGSTKYIFRYITGISDKTTICLEKYFSGMLSVFSKDFTSRIQTSGIVEIEICSA